MTKIKSASVKGIFYPEKREELLNLIYEFKKVEDPIFRTRLVIAPHAGLVYSGDLAYKSILHLNKDIENIFVLAPAHKVYFEGISLLDYDEMEAPFSNIKINRNITDELCEKFNAKYNTEAFNMEHSIEVELPIISYLYRKINIVPILIGKEKPENIKNILSYYYKDKRNGFIISSDLSHFLNDEEAKKLDSKTALMIETNNSNGFSYNQACGAMAIYSLIEFAKEMNFSLIRLDMKNSSSTTKDKTRVVGYGGWALYEGEKNEFIKKYYSAFLINLVRKIIKKENIDEIIPAVLNSQGASFITLNKNGQLRGCIGSIIAHQPLIKDIVSNSINSAYNDPRFIPVRENEINELEICISLLSEPKRIIFKDEDDLLNKIVKDEDGIIIHDKGLRAVYLPSVWEQLPDKKLFLNSLKQKAGMEPDYFSKTFEAYRFHTSYIK